MTILASQPFKLLYALGATGFELARLPLWLVKYITSYGRQNASYSFRQALGVRMFFSIIYHMATVQVKTPLPLTPGKEKERFIVIQAAEDKFYKGPLRSNPDVKEGDVGGTWYPAPLSSSSDLSNVLVVLHIHGGAYVVGDGRTEATGFLTSKLLKHTPATHILCPQYRLSALPASKTSNPFPAALQDNFTAYLYLISELKVPAKNIVISGDSAGGNNAIALLRYLTEYGSDLAIPSPGAALLWSPWINPADNEVRNIKANPNFGTDYLPPPFLVWGSAAYAGSAGTSALQQPYASLKNKPFRSDVPMFVNAGDKEMLYFDGKEWVEMMAKAGNKVTLNVEKNVPHDVLLLGNILGFEKEAGVSAKMAGEWLKELPK